MGISSRATALLWPRPGSVGRLLCAWMLLVAGILAGGFAAPAAQAGIILDWESDASYRDLADDYPSVGFLNFQISSAHYVCSGTLVAHRWVLTAAHCADGATNMSVRFGSDYYSVDETVVHPDWSSSVSEGNDIALVQLSTAVTGIVPSALYTGSDELGQIATYVGFGRGGNGLTGPTSGTGTARAGQNVIDSVDLLVTDPSAGTILADFADSIFFADFDDGSSAHNVLDYHYSNFWMSATSDAAALDLEILVAPGDSGGGVFLDVGGSEQVAGVNSFVVSLTGSVGFEYGDFTGSTRVSSFSPWITAYVPEPGTGALLALGLAGLGLRRRAH